MKVIHLIGGGDTGGAKTHVLNLLKGLNSHIEARLVCFRKGEFSDDAKKMGVPITVIESGNPLVGLRELKKIMRDFPADIIHCHGARGNLMGNMLRRWLRVPVVTTVHSDYRLDYLGRPVARLSYGTTNILALRRVNYYIGVSDPMAELLIERKFPANRIYTLYNGIDFNSPLPFKPREEFFKEIGFPYEPGDIVAGIAARLNPVKDHPTLIRAMKLALEENPRIKLLIAGDGEDNVKLHNLTKELGIEENVFFAGWVEDMNSFYASIDINLLTSISETFPYVLTEGARMRRATIASRVGGVPILIDSGKNGLIFTPGDERELAKHLVTLANDEKLRKSMGDSLFEKAKSGFSIDKMVEDQLKIYENIILREARAKENPRDGVVVCGAYGAGNAGDEAILKSIIQSVREMDPLLPITVLAKNTLDIKKRFRVNSVYTLNILKVLQILRRSLLYINGGGTLIQNATSHRSLWYYLFTLQAARKLGCKVDMYGCGIGPVKGKLNIRLASRVLENSVDAVTLREGDSVRELKGFGVSRPKIELSADPAFALTMASDDDIESFLNLHELSGKYICFMLRTWYGFSDRAEDFAKLAQYAYVRYGLTPVFISLNILNDTKAAMEVTPYLSCPWKIIDDFMEPELLIALLSRMDAVVSMRLHGLILSSFSGTPMVGVSYDPKIGSFLRYLGLGDGIELRDATEDNLRSALDAALKNPNMRRNISARARELKELERKNIEAVRELLHTSRNDS